ncbi:MAG: glycosyltransferase family 2 protein [Clostridia bacterium]|nr:glycosyltransferase family 2 protein [Clostridia bacterium]
MLGVVILNYKNYDDTINCVKSFCDCGYSKNYKFYIIDNNSPNDSFVKLKEVFENNENIVLIKSEVNGGYSAGNNIGLKMAVADGCDVMLLSNSDVAFSYGAVETMEKSLFSDENCGIVGPKVFDGQGNIQNRNKRILTPKIFLLKRKGFEWLDFKKRVKKYGYYDYDYSYPLKVEGMVSGCCFMIKAKVLEEIGYLDEGVFLYHEEDILGAKLRKNGYYALLNPNAEIVHLEGKSTGGLNAFLRFNTLYSGLYYLWKYTETKKLTFNFVFFISKLMFALKAITSKEYRKYYKKLKTEVRNLKKCSK